VGDLSASVQLQLNALRDGPATANYAIDSRFANSASLALNATMLGGMSLSYIATLSFTNVHSVASQWGTTGLGRVHVSPGSSTNPGYIEFLTPDGTRRGYIGWQSNTPNKLTITGETIWGWDFPTNSGAAPTIGGNAILHTASSLAASQLTGTVPLASISLESIQQHQANITAGNATQATTATTASNALALQGISPAITDNSTSVVVRSNDGFIFGTYFNSSASIEGETPALDRVFAGYDAFIRPIAPSTFGSHIQTRNITGRTGTNKTLAAGSGPPSLSGSTNGDLFYYY